MNVMQKIEILSNASNAIGNRVDTWMESSIEAGLVLDIAGQRTIALVILDDLLESKRLTNSHRESLAGAKEILETYMRSLQLRDLLNEPDEIEFKTKRRELWLAATRLHRLVYTVWRDQWDKSTNKTRLSCIK
jgi:hypothetical protein